MKTDEKLKRLRLYEKMVEGDNFIKTIKSMESDLSEHIMSNGKYNGWERYGSSLANLMRARRRYILRIVDLPINPRDEKFPEKDK